MKAGRGAVHDCAGQVVGDRRRSWRRGGVRCRRRRKRSWRSSSPDSISGPAPAAAAPRCRGRRNALAPTRSSRYGGGGSIQPDPQRRREQLGHAARRRDLIGQHRPQRGNRRPVVPVLGVVVVLDDQPALGGPLHQLAPPLALQYDAGRELVRRSASTTAAHRGSRRTSTRSPSSSTGIGGVSRPQFCRCWRDPSEPGSSTAISVIPSRLEHLGEQAERLGDAGDDDEVVGIGGDRHGCGPASWRRRRRKAGVPRRVAVPEVGRREIVEHRALGPQPGRPREGGEIRHAGCQVDPSRRRPQRVEDVEHRAEASTARSSAVECRWDQGPSRLDRGGDDDGAGPASPGDVAVFGEALVGLGDDAAGDLQLGRPGRGWRAAGCRSAAGRPRSRPGAARSASRQAHPPARPPDASCRKSAPALDRARCRPDWTCSPVHCGGSVEIWELTTCTATPPPRPAG